MPQSPWTHSICDPCWKEKFKADKGNPVRIYIRNPEVCCFCKCLHRSGIFVREDPRILACGGIHE